MENLDVNNSVNYRLPDVNFVATLFDKKPKSGFVQTDCTLGHNKTDSVRLNDNLISLKRKALSIQFIRLREHLC